MTLITNLATLLGKGNKEIHSAQPESLAAFQGRKAIVVTMHGKEKVIRPAFSEFGFEWVDMHHINTDSLGTFSGEVARLDNMYNTALKKAKMGLSNSHYDIAMASEGSFVPHPDLPWCTINSEIMVFYDAVNNWISSEKSIETNTNYGELITTSYEEALNFAYRKLFPTHGMILNPHLENSNEFLFKGIQNIDEFKETFNTCKSLSKEDKVRIQTDMRAHMNPTRMKVIAHLAQQLAARIKNNCPKCEALGFGLTEKIPGLPCRGCGSPTDRIHYELWVCSRCQYAKRNPRTDGIKFTEPQYCFVCNP